ncbi:MAG: SDR family NAD(P)-dependent oxidoreductase [Deltaproteobacteria bacterium]|nr:SDR family NAD(P)-dependent oxidoreductase [Deltaproteobacteria bacterium]MBW2696745.1 SDR family NAD(P)-dependent oxidoreductase [Deltaproteobacteria bacterium]
MDFRGKVAIVTGASSGIGRITALRLARLGCRVVPVARRAELLESLVVECNALTPGSHYLAGDLGERDFAQHVVDDTVSRHDRLDVLIHNAAIPLHKSLYRTSVEDAERVLRVNFLSCLWTTFAAIPPMLVRGGGHIVNVSSFAAKVVPTHESVYAASKAAMNAFSEGLWNDLAGSGIHVALVHPGPIDTEIWQKLDEPGHYAGRLYPAESVADAIVEVIEKRRHEIVVPRRNPALVTARLLRFFFPALIRIGVQRTDPVDPDSVERARRRAREGKRLGEE